jgi:microcin C transport system substrate-binding protein
LRAALLLALAATTLATAGGGAAGRERHGEAIDGALKYGAGFSHFDYANPKAPVGGKLTLSAQGSFDTLNPFSLKGRAPLLLGGLVFESLTENSLDEPFSIYGLLARSIEIAPDGMSVTFRLNPKARFSDGKPVTAEDVIFSFRMLRSKAASPFYRYYYKDISSLKALDRRTVRLGFSRRNKELPLIAGQVPVLPRHFYEGKDFGRDFVQRALGSGPYTVAKHDFGKSIRYARNPKYWGWGEGVNRGKYNFAEIEVKFYRDDTVRLEALKAGEFDFMRIASSKQWAVDVAGSKWDKGYVVKELLKHRNNAGIQGFVFNTRLPIFRQREVRHALALAMDFEWSNRTLFYGQYTANHSYFSNSELAAVGLPSPEELKLLEPWRGKVPEAVFSKPVGVLGKAYKTVRERLRAAKRMLSRAGWEVNGGVLTHSETARKMRFTVTLVSPAFERVVEPFLNNLRKLGVRATAKVVDDAVYEKVIKAHDFEMVVGSFGQSQSPGNEQRDYWHSAAADQEGSRNLPGIRNPAVDALVEALIKAPNRKALITATRALDRVLWHEHYLVPHWYIAAHRVTYWNKLSHPKTLPLYYNPLSFLMYWWVEPGKERGLAAAVQAGRRFTFQR